MKKEEKIDDILRNVKVVYTDGFEEFFDVLKITKEGLVIGRFYDNNFFPCGFIPRDSYKDIKY